MDRRLTRSNEECILGGVCGGIADFFGIDPIIIRIIFIFSGGLGGLYLLLWIALPKDD